MNSEHTRKLIAEGVIALAIVAGAYMTLVDPARRTLVESQSATADQNSMRARALSEGGGLEQARAALERANQRVQAIHDAGEPARDELIAFERLTQLAAEANVTVEQLQRRDLPKSAPPQHPPQASAQGTHGSPMLSPVNAGVPTPHHRDVLVGFAMTAEGTYESLVTLVDRLAQQRESTAIESITVTPAGDASNPRVRAAINTVHYAFDAARARMLVEQAMARLSEAEAAR